MDYNFVIFGSDGGFYKTAYSDIMELNSVIYRESLWGVNNKITALIYKLYHTSRLPNRHLPFKNLLYGREIRHLLPGPHSDPSPYGHQLDQTAFRSRPIL